MVAGKLSDLARESHPAIGEQDLGLADAAGIEDEFARCGEACVVLVAEAEIEIAERDPAALAAPADMDDALLVGEERLELGAGLRRVRLLHDRFELERPGLDMQRCH